MLNFLPPALKPLSNKAVIPKNPRSASGRSKTDSKMCREKKYVSSELVTEEQQQKVGSGIEDYTLGNQIGQGAYAVVKSGIHKETRRQVAVKVYEKYKLISSQRKNCVSREIQILKKLDHENIVKLYETIDTSRQLYLVMELIKGKSMLNYIKNKHGKRMDESEGIRVFKQVLDGIRFCHQQNIVHRDIKMENVLLDDRLNVKIIDFGFSTWSPPLQKLKIFCGTPSYMAPEIVNKKEYYGPPADMWSLGVLLYAMLCGSFPFKGVTELELYRNISKGLFSVPTYVSGLARNLICKLLNVNPQRRPSADDIAKDPLFMYNGLTAAA